MKRHPDLLQLSREHHGAHVRFEEREVFEAAQAVGAPDTA